MDKKLKRVRSEDIIPPLRASVAALLISRYGFSKKDAATVLCVTPAAVSQYMKGSRGVRLRELLDGEAQLVVEELTQKVAGGLDADAVELNLLDAAKQIISLKKGSKMQPKAEGEIGELAALLNARRLLEIKTAQRCLKATDNIRDELIELLFRQIAADSLRHADIVSHIFARLDKLNEPYFTDAELQTLRAVLEMEDEAIDSRLDFLKETSPTVKALLTSIDIDEKKHTKILKIALGEHVGAEEG
ncbi:MAG: hypothetical protein QXN08_00660 [Nitrososphaerales archaeon]